MWQLCFLFSHKNESHQTSYFEKTTKRARSIYKRCLAILSLFKSDYVVLTVHKDIESAEHYGLKVSDPKILNFPPESPS